MEAAGVGLSAGVEPAQASGNAETPDTPDRKKPYKTYVIGTRLSRVVRPQRGSARAHGRWLPEQQRAQGPQVPLARRAQRVPAPLEPGACARCRTSGCANGRTPARSSDAGTRTPSPTATTGRSPGPRGDDARALPPVHHTSDAPMNHAAKIYWILRRRFPNLEAATSGLTATHRVSPMDCGDEQTVEPRRRLRSTLGERKARHGSARHSQGGDAAEGEGARLR
jgi:hypothetical protein